MRYLSGTHGRCLLPRNLLIKKFLQYKALCVRFDDVYGSSCLGFLEYKVYSLVTFLISYRVVVKIEYTLLDLKILGFV